MSLCQIKASSSEQAVLNFDGFHVTWKRIMGQAWLSQLSINGAKWYKEVSHYCSGSNFSRLSFPIWNPTLGIH